MLIVLSLESFRLVEKATSENIHDRCSFAGTDRDRNKGQPPAWPPPGGSSPNRGVLSQAAPTECDGQTDGTTSELITRPRLPSPGSFVRN